MKEMISRLLHSEDPSIRFLARKNLSEIPLSDDEEAAFSEEIRAGYRTRELLSELDNNGEIPVHPYKKWYGAHWVLLALSDLEYPRNDVKLKPLVEQVLNWILSSSFLSGIKEVRGLVRGHSCIVGNAIHYLCKLGLEDERVQDLVQVLLKMQWKDGGWNCDRKPSATSSSFNSTAISIRGLVSYRKALHTIPVDSEIQRGISFLVERELCKRRTTQEIAHTDFLKLFFPEYYHYSVLYGLRVIAESGYSYDPRLEFALTYLRSIKTNSGWPTTKKYYWKSRSERAGRSLISWETSRSGEVNDFVTVHSTGVLNYFEKARN